MPGQFEVSPNDGPVQIWPPRDRSLGLEKREQARHRVSIRAYERKVEDERTLARSDHHRPEALSCARNGTVGVSTWTAANERWAATSPNTIVD